MEIFTTTETMVLKGIVMNVKPLYKSRVTSNYAYSPFKAIRAHYLNELF